jgi:hypothetical protein
MPRPSNNRTLRSYYMGAGEDIAIQAIQLHHGLGSISDAVRFAVRTVARDLPELKQLEDSARAEEVHAKAATKAETKAITKVVARKAAPKKRPATKRPAKRATR